MQKNNYTFTCTSYNKINEESTSLDRIIHTKTNYNQLLKTSPGNSTVVTDIGEFKEECDVIVSNRIDEILVDVVNKVYTRDLFGRD